MKTALILFFLCLTALLQNATAQPAGNREKHRLIENEQRRSAALMRALATPPAANSIDVTYYRLDLAVTTPPLASGLAGSVFVMAASRSDTLRHVPLDLSDPMTVDSVVMNGTRLSFSRGFSLLIVVLDRVYPTGEVVTFTVYYRGVPDPSGFGSFVFDDHNDVPWVWSLSQPYGARDWWPCKDHPLDKADSVDILVTCDRQFKVGSNGRLVGVTDNGDGTHTYAWSERYPIATYLVSIAVTNYVEFSDWFRYTPTDSMEVLNYVLPEHFAEARASLAPTVRMLEIFSQLFGLYPFVKEKYGHSFFGSGGAMEHQTMTSTTTYDEYVIAHELAHQWFGDLITCRSWRDLWLNEGFATYGEALYVEARDGILPYRSYMRQILESAKRARGTLRVQDTTSVPNLFNGSRVYDKGGSVLHMLRRVIGDSLFFAALRAYVADPRFRFGTAVTEDFREVCERVSGRNLRLFFDQWVDGEGFPWYEYRWSARPAPGGFETSVHVMQRAKSSPPSAFVMPLDCRLRAGTWDTTVVLQNDGPDQIYTFLLPREPDTVRLDPNGWMLAEFTNLNENDVLPGRFALRQNYPNPFNPGTTIGFDLARQVYVSLKVYDLLGREVAVLIDGTMPAGYHEARWDRTADPAASLASGVYLYRLLAGDFSAARTMLLLR